MLTNREKRTIENVMEGIILNHPTGINTKQLNNDVYNRLAASIPNMNMHHVAGMLSWVYKHYGHRFIVRTPGYSIIQ